MVVKEFIHLRSDWWLPVFMLVAGTMELFLVAWVTSRPITNLPVMILDQSQSAASRAFVSGVENTKTFAEPQTGQRYANHTGCDGSRTNYCRAGHGAGFRRTTPIRQGQANVTGHREWRGINAGASSQTRHPRTGEGILTNASSSGALG